VPHDTQALFDKIHALPPERIAGVALFAKVWENPEDDAYDAL
jgi:hypothetical protein